MRTVNIVTFALALAIPVQITIAQDPISCYFCNDVNNITLCEEQKVCNASVHSCFVEEKANSALQVTYSMGCETKSTCSIASTSTNHVIVGRRQLDPGVTAITTCFKCCEGSLCNKVDCKDLCTHNPCQNNGTCTSQRYGSTLHCACPPGYSGKHCEQDIDECVSAPCRNGGTCTDQFLGFTCKCTAKASGTLCENAADGSLCQQCQGVNHPLSCKNTVFCPAQDCFVEQTLLNGQVSYNLGCRAREQCTAAATRDARPRRQDPVVQCTHCCKNDSCNAHLCYTARPSCLSHLSHGATASGVYALDLGDHMPQLLVYCDMTTDGGGWVVLQRRKDGSENFFRNWDNYAKGFGNLTGEFWLGNDILYRLGQSGMKHLRIDMRDENGVSSYAKYSSFSVDDGRHNYKLHISGYSGNATDALAVSTSVSLSHSNQLFSTMDKDNDKSPANCATEAKGGWWYSDCFLANLNGPYGLNNGLGMEWNVGHGSHPRVFTEMKVREK